MVYSIMPNDTFKKLMLNAGVLVRNFDPKSGEINEEDILAATTGGISFSATTETTDFGEDIDNCPPNMLELKRKGATTAVCSGTFVAIDAELVAMLIGGATIDPEDQTHIIPNSDFAIENFKDLWIIGDYSDVNENKGEAKAGYIAIHMMNTLSTGGFSMQTTKDGKGNFAFEFTAHYSMSKQDVVPFEIYVRQGSETEGYSLPKANVKTPVNEAS